MKKSAVKFLLKYGIKKDDPDFKEIFGFVYRGASFALVSLCILCIFCWNSGTCFMHAHWVLTLVCLMTEDVHGIGGDQYEPDRQMC